MSGARDSHSLLGAYVLIVLGLIVLGWCAERAELELERPPEYSGER